MKDQFREHIHFKMSQRLRLLGFDFKQEGAREKARVALSPFLKDIVRHAFKLYR